MTQPLNPDVYAMDTLTGEYREQMDRHARACRQVNELERELELAKARRDTAKERADSLVETLIKLGAPVTRDAATGEVVDVSDIAESDEEFFKHVRLRCMGPWPYCGHNKGVCTADPEYQERIQNSMAEFMGTNQ